jgi:oligopeptide transport system substrate-binding protein
MMSRRGVLLPCLGLLLASCGRQASAPSGAAPPVLRFGNGSEPKDLDPGTQASLAEFNVEGMLFEGLVSLADDGFSRLPGVAERWDVSPDGLTYTFHLRADARWSDGTPVTADDFAFSFRRVFIPSLAAANAVEGYIIVGAQEIANGQDAKLGVEAPDPRTFIIHLKYRAPYLIDYIATTPFLPVERSLVERLGGAAQFDAPWTKPGTMVSNGPYVLKEWRSNQQIVVVKNPYYWDAAHIRVNEIHVYPTDDMESEERSFRAGQIDVTYSLPTNKLAVYAAQDHSPLHVAPDLGTEYLDLNTAVAPLNDVRVRRALGLALDREHLIPQVLHEGGTAAHSLTRPGTGGYFPPPCVDFDLPEARRLLAAAGYPAGRGFPPLSLTYSTSHVSNLPEAIQEVWRRDLGIQVTLEGQEGKTTLDRLYAKNYQLALASYSYEVNAAETMLLIQLSDSNWNYTNWKSPAFDAAYRAAGDAVDDAGRRACFDRMETILREEAPLLPLYYYNRTRLISPRVRGWKDNNAGVIRWANLSLAP